MHRCITHAQNTKCGHFCSVFFCCKAEVSWSAESAGVAVTLLISPIVSKKMSLPCANVSVSSDPSVCVYLTRICSGLLCPDVKLQEVPVERRTAEPRFTEMDTASQKVLIPSRMDTALWGDVDPSTPASPSGSTPNKHLALLTKQPAHGRHRRRVVVGARRHTAKEATSSYRDVNERDKDVRLNQWIKLSYANKCESKQD